MTGSPSSSSLDRGADAQSPSSPSTRRRSTSHKSPEVVAAGMYLAKKKHNPGNCLGSVLRLLIREDCQFTFSGRYTFIVADPKQLVMYAPPLRMILATIVTHSYSFMKQ